MGGISKAGQPAHAWFLLGRGSYNIAVRFSILTFPQGVLSPPLSSEALHLVAKVACRAQKLAIRMYSGSCGTQKPYPAGSLIEAA